MGIFVRQEKFDMVIEAETWAFVQSAVRDQNLISPDLIERFGWRLVLIDDNNVNDSAVKSLGATLKSLGIQKYYSIPINELQSGVAKAHLRTYFVDDVRWSAFFEFDDHGHADYLEDCIFFSQPIKFLLLRTGDVRHTIYAGSKHFLEKATGAEMNDAHAVALGNYWPDSRIEDLYKPVRR